MLSLAQVSSMNTSRSGSRSGCRSRHRARAAATSGRSCWVACRLFFEAEPFSGAEPPHRPVTDLQTPFRQLPTHLLQRQVRLGRDPLQQPLAMLSRHQRTPPAAHGHRRNAPCPPMLLNPANDAAHPNAEPTRRLPPARACIHRRYRANAKIIGNRSAHRGWPPPSQHLESQFDQTENPPDSIKPDDALASPPSDLVGARSEMADAVPGVRKRYRRLRLARLDHRGVRAGREVDASRDDCGCDHRQDQPDAEARKQRRSAAGRRCARVGRVLGLFNPVRIGQ